MKKIIFFLFSSFIVMFSCDSYGGRLACLRSFMMSSVDRIQNIAELGVNYYFSVVPRKSLSKEQLVNVKVVAHRGAHDNKSGIIENTKEAFDRALSAGIWGIEFDIRFTKDNVPVVNHDPNTGRFFNDDLEISQVTFDELRTRVPKILTFAELVKLYGKKLHLMAELKEILTLEQSQIIKSILSQLSEVVDFHLLALDPMIFLELDGFKSESLILVAETNTTMMSESVEENGFGGFAGHLLLMRQAFIARHQLKNVKIGTGFISSKNALKREVNRGVDFLFTNDGLKIQYELDKLRSN